MQQSKLLPSKRFVTEKLTTLSLALLSVIVPAESQAQRASVSVGNSKMTYFSFVNGGGIEITSNIGLIYDGTLNRRVKNYADPLFMTINDTLMINGFPESMQNMNDAGILYQHALNPEISKGKMDVRNKLSLSLRIGGTMAIYQDMMIQSQDTMYKSSSGTSLSIFPSLVPSVFSSSTDL